MQHRKKERQAMITLDTVWAAIAELERTHSVHCHYVFRRDQSVKSKDYGRVILFCRRLGVGDEGRTVHSEACSYPTPDGISLEALLYQMTIWADNRLDEAEATARAEQGSFLP
jgi:hypothetical protein